MSGFFAALGVVFVAELGDKSQLLVLTLATRYSAWSVLAGLATVAAVLMGVSVAVGAGLSNALPTDIIEVVAGAAFIVFGLWTLRPERDEVDGGNPEEGPPVDGRSGFLAAVLSIGAAELGDKTMLAAVGLAASSGALGVWAGATIGMVASSGLAILVGTTLGKRIPRDTLRYVSAALFIAFGIALAASGLT